MEIPEKGPLQSPPARKRSAERLQQLPAGPTGVQNKAAERDTVSLTASGRDFNATVEHAHSLPDIREDRVMQLKRQLEEGTYRIEGRRIAVNMIDEALENNQAIKHIDSKA